MSLSRGRRRPVDIDNDGAIDFSGVSSAQVVRPTVPPVLLQNAVVGSEVRKQVTKMDEGASLMPKAVDSRFNSYVNRPLPRRRVGFGSATATAFTVSAAASSAPLGGADVPTKVHTAVGSASERNACAESSNRLAALLLDEESQRQEESQRSNREQYEREMHDLWTRGCAVACESAKAPELSKDASVVELRWEGSLLGRFFRDGVPDVEPWDHWALTVPRYSPANAATSVVLNRIYHIVLPQTYYMGYCLRSDEKKPVTLRLPKTREELRVERLERLRRAKEEQDRAKKAAAQQASSSVNALGTMGGTASTQDRLSNRSLRYGLFGDSVLNPLGTDNKVFSQYQERFLNHQRRNHERHVAAIPHQIEKRKRDLQRHAEERPVLRAYRVYPVYSPAQLGKLRNFANDNLLRGFVLWACKCDAIIVLSGGEVAMRHVDRWIMEKMKWESSETRAMCLMTCPLPEASTFSFVGSRQRKASDLSRHKPAEAHAATANDVKREYVYMNFVDSLREVEEFLCSVPTTGPWRDLLHIWRAVLAAGSAIFSYHTTEEMSANAISSQVRPFSSNARSAIMFSCPPFSLTKPRYDMDTYAGRTLYFFSTTNPLLCFETAASLRRHKELLDRVAAGEKVEASNKYLWKARTAVDICVHPTTGDVIFPLFRMCAFLPVNSFIIPFMMAPSTIRSVPRTVFIQWFNQSYNSAVNYANRSSDKQPVWGLITAYAAAVSVSVAGALAATAAMNRVQGGTMKATFLRATLPFIAVSSGSIVNLAMMRKNEWMPSGSGLKVTDEDGETRGLSRAAGVDSLLRCSFTRVVWNVLSMVLPLLFVPPLTSSFAFARANAALVEGALQISSLAVGVPMALGAFSTTVFISPNRLESEFQELKRRDGTPVKIFSYYKGL